MAATKRHFLVLLLFLVQKPSCLSEKQPDTLNVLSILLPYSTAGSANVNFTVWASEGCYKWSSSRPEIAKVSPVLKPGYQGQGDDVCSQEVVVTSQSTSPDKQTAIIIAEEKVSGHVLRCDVFVNSINRIDITTTTRELLLGQSPELLDVQAYDDTGNLFSSLDGLVFDWDLITVTGSIDAASVLRIVPFAESINETSVAIYELEAKGLRGHSIIVEGVNTGTAIVQAKLRHHTFKNVLPSSVKLLVIDNLMIMPSMDVYIMINTAIKYSVKRFRQNAVIDIEMPCTQFKFSLSNTTVGVLDRPSSRVIGRSVGFTQVTLLDNNMMDSQLQSSRQPVAGVHVVQPDHLGFTIHPDSNWILETQRDYVVTVDIYDKQNHKLYVAENIIINTKFEVSYFSVLHSTNNGSYHAVSTLKSGKTVLDAVLKSVRLITTGELVNLDPPITGQQEVIIYDPIYVTPAVLVFPWIPNSGEYYKYELKATGGSGVYTWTSELDAIATVNARGVLTTATETGVTLVKAHDTKNMKHFSLTKVYVLPPEELKFIPSRVEVEIGSKLKIPLAVAAYLTPESTELKFFDDCRRMNLTITVSDPTIFHVLGTSDESDSIVPPSCTSVYVKALRQGYVILTAKYKYKDISIKATTTIAAYIPLKPLHPVDVAVVSLGSAKNLILQGGPQPWVHDRSTHYEQIQAENEDTISLRTDVIPDHPFVDKRSLHFYHVTCKTLGEQDLTVTIGNKPCETNLYPASSNATIRFACMVPATLTLEPDVHLPEIAERQLSLQDCQSPNKEFHVRSPQDLKLRMILRDGKNRLFDNFTSLDVLWSSSNYDMASFDVDTGVQMMYSEDDFTKPGPLSISYQVCHLKRKQGSVTINAAVTKYRREILQKAGVKSKEILKKPLTSSLRLSLTSDIRVEPTEASIFNHPMNKVDLKIFGGSGHFIVKGSDDDIARVTTAKSTIKVTPKSVGVVTVTVYDQCLDSPNPATASIRVSDIESILVAVVDKVELGHVINCTVMVLDELHKPLLVSSLELLNLSPRFSRDLLNIKPSSTRKLDKALYTLRGVAIGNTILTFTAAPPQKPQITSDPKPIQVFPPLRLDPRYIILIPGATFQLRATGGPYPQATTLFSINNKTVASVDSVGLITAKVPGKSTVAGAVEATDPQSGHTIVFSKDHVIVEVLRLTGVKIFTPSTNLVTETEIGLRAVGLNDESPFTFANAIPGIEFHWSSSNIDVCKLKSVYEKSGINIDTEKAFRVVLQCDQPGEAVIKLQAVFTDVTLNQAVEYADLYDDVRIQVFEKLRLIHPPDGQLLLPNEVNARIRTNRDGGKLSYSLMDVCRQGSDSRPLLSVDNRGHVQTGMTSGTAGVLVTSREDFGVNQTLVVHVEVKSVASISISPQTPVHTLSHKLHAFPVGMSAIFSVFLHDNVGRKFDSSNVPLKHRLNRLDSIHISQGPDNGTYSIRAHNNGEAILNVWLISSPHIADYVHLRATHAIVPYRPSYYVGDIVCFKETVVGDEDNGIWWASQGNVLSVSPRSGVSIATASGNSLLYYNASNLLPTHIEVKVSPVDDVTIMDSGQSLVISVSPGPSVNGSYVIHVRFGKSRGGPVSTGCSDPILQGMATAEKLLFPFSCELALSDGLDARELFDLRPGYDAHGQSACFAFPRKMLPDVAKFLSTAEARMTLIVTLRDPGKGTEVTSDVARLDYVPSFYVSQSEVELNSTVREVKIEVYGTPTQLSSLEVNSHSPSIAVNRRDESDSTVAYIHITLVDDHVHSFHDVIVELKSTLTTQHVPIAVSYTSGIPAVAATAPPAPGPVCQGPSCPTRSTQPDDDFSLRYFLIILFTILIIIIIMLLCRRPTPYTQRGGQSPYGKIRSPYPAGDGTRNPVTDSFAGSTYPYTSDVSPATRRRQSPMLARRATPGSSPRGLFSVTQ